MDDPVQHPPQIRARSPGLSSRQGTLLSRGLACLAASAQVDIILLSDEFSDSFLRGPDKLTPVSRTLSVKVARPSVGTRDGPGCLPAAHKPCGRLG